MHDRSPPQDSAFRRFGGNVIGLSRRFRRASPALFRTLPLPPHTTLTMVRAAPRARHSRYPSPRRVNRFGAIAARSKSVTNSPPTLDTFRRSRSSAGASRLMRDRGPVFLPRLSDLLHRFRLCHATRERLNDRTGSYLRIRRPRGRAPRHGQPPAGHLRGCPPGVPR